MRVRISLVVLCFTLSASASAKEVFLSISGKASGFFTDARIFNPSFTKDITVNAQYLPDNVNNTGAAVVPLVIPKRSMRTFDDAVQSMFSGGGGRPLGGIRLTSDDDFIASQRIYQDLRTAPQAGTLGQFVPGLELSQAKTKGSILQLKAGATTLGQFRTNWGGINPNTTVANVTLRLYDKNNAVISTKTREIQPYGIVSPTNIVSFFEAGSADLSDAWISFTSDVSVILYGSVVDGGSGDPTCVPATDDSGVPPPPPDPTTKTVTVTAQNWDFSLTGHLGLKPGDEVTFVIRSIEDLHGFRLFAPDGTVLAEAEPIGTNPTNKTVTLGMPGTYTIICIRTICGEGHTDMNATFVVEEASDPRDPY
jgi:heme/copper-type cytochrome/quinol oxidase subunit 2